MEFFEKREAELLKLNEELDRKRAAVLKQVDEACRPGIPSAPKDENNRIMDSLRGDDRNKDDASKKLEKQLRELSIQLELSNKQNEQLKTELNKVNTANKRLEKDYTAKDARIHKLQEEIDRSKSTNTELKSAEKQVKELNIQMERSFKKIQEDGLLIESLKKENEQIKLEIEKVSATNKRVEKELSLKDSKIHKLLDDVDRTKALNAELKAADKNRITTDKSENEMLQNECRRLEKQRTELLAAFKKQMKLIDVLRRQKLHLEAARALAFSEEEFIRVLELGEKLNM